MGSEVTEAPVDVISLWRFSMASESASSKLTIPVGTSMLVSRA
jgi:hypothetical protein